MPQKSPQSNSSDGQEELDLFYAGISDPILRKEMAKDFKLFCLIYLAHHFNLEPADFAGELIQNLQDDSIDALEIIGFRGSAKSTFAATAYVLYAALVKPDLYPFIVILTATSTLATATIAGVKRELEENELLKQDFGVPTFVKLKGTSWEVRNKLESKDDWQAQNLLLTTGVRIMGRSRGQRIRGIRHRHHRIKLAIGDDIDDLTSVATQESRDKTAKWWRGEVIGALALEARRILIGNWLHLDGLMARMKDSGRYKVLEYPLLKDGMYLGEGDVERCAWKAAYPTQEKIDEKRKEMGDIDFRREMLLQVVPEAGQPVMPEDIHYYDEPPFDDGNYLAHGVDLAISTKESADYTACVSGEITWPAGKLEIYIQPNPINKHMGFHDTMNELDHVRRASDMSSEFFVEAVQYQQAAIEEMERRAFSVQGMRPIKDKLSRLRVAARYIKNGTVKFPRKGCEVLIHQLLGFGSEKHDDLVDALVWLVLGVVGDGIEEKKVHYV